jgi:hypothetical protein
MITAYKPPKYTRRAEEKKGFMDTISGWFAKKE